MVNRPPRRPLFSYRCSICGDTYNFDYAGYVCLRCRGNLDLRLDFQGLSPGLIRNSREPSLWRYTPLLPVSPPPGDGTVLHAAGWTPLYRPERLAAQSGVLTLLVKDEGRNPTASFKDRASAIVAARALDLGVRTIVTASSGNAGAAMAGMAASAGLDAVILVPRTAPQAKIAQLLVFGARVVLVDGTYDDAFDLSLEAAEAFGWYCRNTGFNAFTLEGKKTAAFEIWEQCPPAYFSTEPLLNIFVSVGDGNIISGLHKGFKDLLELGWIDAIPRIFGVQAEGSAAVAKAYFAGTETISPVRADTIADSISVGMPRDGRRALRAARETGGAYVTVSDAEILAAIPALGSAGIFAEPARAAAFAGFIKAVASETVAREAPSLVLNTGSGLKDVAAAMRAAGKAPIIAPRLEELARVLRLEP